MRIALLLLGLSLPPTAQAHESLVWAGVDYSLVQMIGSGDFRQPDSIFPGYLNKWNAMVLDEQLDELKKRLHHDIVPRTSFLTARHAGLDATEHIQRDDLIAYGEALLTREEVARQVRGYELEGDGMGVVLVAEQLNKSGEMGCYWATFFDIESSRTYETTRLCGETGGVGFRNHWFGSIKSTVAQLKMLKVPHPK